MTCLGLLLLSLMYLTTGVLSRCVPLLRPGDGQLTLQVDPRGLALLESFGSMPMAVIVVIGRARTGKSFSLNHILGQSHENGFTVGHTATPQTIGVTIWDQPITSTDPNCKHSYLIVDSEGLGTGIPTYDKALQVFATVFSARIIYHLGEYIYTDDVMRLFSAASLALHYERLGMLEAFGNDTLLPPLTWLIQRYHLAGNTSPSAAKDILFNTWLHERPNPHNDPLVASYNSTVRAVTSFFPSHSVYLAPDARRTSIGVDALAELSHDELSQGYRETMASMSAELFDCKMTRPRATLSTATDLARSLPDIMNAANKGVDYIGDRVVDAITRSSIDETMQHLELALDSITLPMDTKSLDTHLDTLLADAERETISRLPHAALQAGAQVHIGDMRRRYALHRSRIHTNNDLASSNSCIDLVALLIVSLRDRTEVCGASLTCFDAELFRVLNEYDATAKGPRAAVIRTSLTQQAASIRISVFDRGAPSRRVTFTVFAATVAFVADRIHTHITGTALFQTFLLVVELASFALATLSALAIFGVTPPILPEHLFALFTHPAVGLALVVGGGVAIIISRKPRTIDN